MRKLDNIDDNENYVQLSLDLGDSSLVKTDTKNKKTKRTKKSKEKSTKNIFKTDKNKNSLFDTFDIGINITTEKQYTKETGKVISKNNNNAEKTETIIKIDDDILKNTAQCTDESVAEHISKSATPEDSLYLSMSKNREASIKNINNFGIDIDSTKKIRNEFIQARIDADNKLRELEIEEIKNIDLEYPYKAVKLVTNAEKQLLYFLENNITLVEKIRILPKIRLGDILNLDSRVDPPQPLYFKISSKHVDFLIVDRWSLDIICVVELDDYTHETEKVKVRDEIVYRSLKAGKIDMFRVKCRIANIKFNDILDIDNYILNYYKPKCGYCGGTTEVITDSTGQRYWRCSHRDCEWQSEINRRQ